MSTADLTVMLTSKGNLESELKSARERVKELGKEISKTTTSGGQVGDKLAREYQQATMAVNRLNREVQDTNRKIKIAASQSSAAAAKIGRAWKKTASIFNNNMVAGISAVSIALAGRQAIRAYAGAEKMQMQLNLAYAKFPAIANVTRQSFDDLNMAIMNNTGADDDALAAAEGMLARFNLTGSQIQKLIPLVNDLSIATGQDLQSASLAVGRAMMGNARGLKAIGINFKTTGDHAKDTAALMQLLTEKVGGTGEAFGKTTAGQMAIAEENFQNLQETIGMTLVPALTALVGVVRPVAEWFKNLSDPVRTAIIVITGVGTAALIITPRIIAMQAAMKLAGISAGDMATKAAGAGRAIGGMAGPIGLALTALSLWIKGNMDAKAAAEGLAGSFDSVSGAATALTRQQLGAEFLKNFSAEDLAQTPFTLKEIVDASLAGGDAMHSLALRVNEYTRTQLASNPTQVLWLSSLESSIEAANRDGQAAAELARATATAGESAGVAAADYADLGLELTDTAEKSSVLTRSLNRLGRAISRQRAIKDFKNSLKTSITKPSADAARDMLDSFLSATNSFKKDSKGQARFVQENYKSVAAAIDKSGIKGKQREELVGPLKAAKSAADDFLNKLVNMDGTEISVVFNGTVNAIRKASGGLVAGPGTGTSDSIPAMLSNGEYVIRAKAVQAIGLNNLNRMNYADKMTDPALLDRIAVQGEQPIAMASAPMIGSLIVNNPSSDIDVEKAVVRGLARAERIRKERG